MYAKTRVLQSDALMLAAIRAFIYLALKLICLCFILMAYSGAAVIFQEASPMNLY